MRTSSWRRGRLEKIAKRFGAIPVSVVAACAILVAACSRAPRPVAPTARPPLFIRQMVAGPQGICTLRAEAGARGGRAECFDPRHGKEIVAKPRSYRSDIVELIAADDRFCIVHADDRAPSPCKVEQDRGQRRDDGRISLHCADDTLFQAWLPDAIDISATDCLACGATPKGVLCRHGGSLEPWGGILPVPLAPGDEPVGWLSDPAYQKVVVLNSSYGCVASDLNVDCWSGRSRWPEARPVVLRGARAIASGDHFVCTLGQDEAVRCVGAGLDPEGEPLPALHGARMIAAGGHTVCALQDARIDCLERILENRGQAEWRDLPRIRLVGRDEPRLAQVRDRRVLVLFGEQLVEYEMRYPHHRAPVVEKRPWLLRGDEQNFTWERREVFTRQAARPSRCAITKERTVVCGDEGEEDSATGKSQAEVHSTIVGGDSDFVVLETGELWRLRYEGGPGVAEGIATIVMPLFAPFMHGGARELAGAEPVKAFENVDVVSVATRGHKRTCVITGGGKAICEGDNYSGEVSGAPTHHPLLPYRMSFEDAVVALSLGANHTCARLKAGDVRCWGRFGPTPIRSADQYPPPIRVEFPR